MRNTYTTTDYYAIAEKAVSVVLRNLYGKSALNLFLDLQTAKGNDTAARNAEYIAAQIGHIEYALTGKRTPEDTETDESAARVRRDFAEKMRFNKTITDSERAYYAWEHEHMRKECERLESRLTDLYKALAHTLSDRADLVQVACLELLTLEREPADITAAVLASYGVESVEDLTVIEREQAQNRANFRAVCNAINRAIRDMATPNAMNRTTTKADKATDEQVTAWIEMYGGTGSAVKVPQPKKRARLSDCYDTMEKRKDGFYRIRHYVTIAPYQYIGDYTEDENGESDAQYLKVYNPFVSNAQDVELLKAMYTCKGLNDRQRLFLESFAKAAAMGKDFKACKAFAFRAVGITTTTNKTTFFNRLKKALVPSYPDFIESIK